MSTPAENPAARALAKVEGDTLTVVLSGSWRIAAERPAWADCVKDLRPAVVRFLLEGEGPWDSSLLLFVHDAQVWSSGKGARIDAQGLPERIRTQVALMTAAAEAGVAPPPPRIGFLSELGLATREVYANLRHILTFVGDCVLGSAAAARRPGKFRWRDTLAEMQQCGAMALPIVSLISILIGLTVAYQAAVQLRQFGADIFIADLVGLSVVREMGPMMTAVILAGRTGAAFAATLGNMRANEEVDALQVLGISPVEFLVLPRIVALGLMMPLLALYADAMGILGGMIVARGILQIPPSAYWIELLTSVGLSDLDTGLVKAVTFGLLVGLAGCLAGLRAERNAVGVGRAATSAVVTAILLIIIADSVYAVIFHTLGV